MKNEFTNRFREYRETNNLTWRELKLQTGISTTTLVKVWNAESLEDMNLVSLGTYRTLKEKIGVDLLS